MVAFVALIRSLQTEEYASSGLAVEEGGILSTPESTRLSNWVQLALRKFHLFTGLVGIGVVGLSEVINEGLCCDLGKWSRMMREGAGPSELANARSGLDVVFQRPEWKLSGCLGS